MKSKKGRLDNVYLRKSEYVSVDTPYRRNVEHRPPMLPLEQENLRPIVKDGHKPLHDVAYKPAKHVKERYYTAAFEHMNERVDVKKQIKDEDGHVITAPKNFYTWKPKKGIVGKRCFFNGQVEWIKDDFNWPKEMARKEMEEGKKLEQEKPFS